MLGTPLLSCFKASGDTAKILGSDRARSLRGIYTLDCGAQHVGLVGGARATGYPRKLDREILADCPSAKIGSLENFRLYGMYFYSISSINRSCTKGISTHGHAMAYKFYPIACVGSSLLKPHRRQYPAARQIHLYSELTASPQSPDGQLPSSGQRQTDSYPAADKARQRQTDSYPAADKARQRQTDSYPAADKDRLTATRQPTKPAKDRLTATRQSTKPAKDRLTATRQSTKPAKDRLTATRQPTKPAKDRLTATRQSTKPAKDRLTA